MNLAISDVAILGEALVALCRDGDATALASYSARALRRVWRAEHFSWWMTSMLHRPPEGDPFEERLQLAQLGYVTSSDAAATSLAENYVGLPLELTSAAGEAARHRASTVRRGPTCASVRGSSLVTDTIDTSAVRSPRPSSRASATSLRASSGQFAPL